MARGKPLVVAITADTKGLKSGLDKGRKKLGAFGGILGKTIKGAAGLGAVFVGASLKKGYDRITTLQDATSQLEVALGDSGAAAEFMGKMLDTVEGTPFNLDQFADAGSTLANMGANAQKIPNYLTAIGEAAAGKGKRATEFVGRLSDAFALASTEGQITGQTLRSMATAGVPAARILANSYGVTTDELKRMASQGLIPAEEGLDRLTEGILKGTDGLAGMTPALEGTMAGLRDNLTGAVGGFGAAMARFGANILEPILPALTKGFQGMSDLTDRAGKAVGRSVTRIVGWITKHGPKIRETLTEIGGHFRTAFETVAPILGGAGDALGVLFSILEPVGRWVADNTPVVATFLGVLGTAAVVLGGVSLAMGALNAVLAASPITWIVLGLAAFAAALVYAWNNSEKFRTVVTKAWEFVSAGFTNLWNTIKITGDRIARAWNWLKDTATSVVSGIQRGLDRFNDGVRRTDQFVAESWNRVKRWFTDLKDSVVRVFSDAWNWLKNAGRQIIDGLIDGIQSGFNRVKNKLGELTSFIPDWKGPPEKDAGLLRNAGVLIMGGLIDGIESERDHLRRTLTDTADIIARQWDRTSPVLDLSSEVTTKGKAKLLTPADLNPIAGKRGRAGGGDTYEITIEVNVPPTADKGAVGREVAEALREFARQGGDLP